MLISQAFHSQMPRLACALGSQLTLENALIGSFCAEACFYASLKGGIKNKTKLVNWIRETSIAHIQLIQNIFNTINAGIVTYGLKNLIDEVFLRYSFSVINADVTNCIVTPFFAVLAFGVTYPLCVFLSSRLPSSILPEMQAGKSVGFENSEVFISETLSSSQNRVRAIHLSKLVLDVALACMMKNRLMVVSLASSGYCLWKNGQLKWMNFLVTCPHIYTPLLPSLKSLKATYRMLVLPSGAVAEEENCAICLDDKPEMAFCANHLFHQCCLAELVEKKSAEFFNVQSIIMQSTENYRNGSYTHTSHKYSIAVPSESLPSCPNCRVLPQQNDFEIEVTDSLHGKFDADITIVRPLLDRQYLFENIYAVYNFFQAGLTCLQRYPELAATIYKIQEVMIVSDIFGYAVNAYYLGNKICEKFKQKKWKLYITPALMVATAALSFFAGSQFNAYFKSTVVLKEVFSRLNISPEALTGVEIDWKSPVLHKVMQTVYVNRIVMMIAFTLFSKNKKRNLLNIAAQILSFTHISQLKWIALSQTWDYPLKRIIEEVGRCSPYVNKDSLKSLNLTTHSLIDSSANIESTLKSVFTFSQSFFNNSAWDSYWLITTTNGVETSREFYYQVTLRGDLFALGSESFLPRVTDYSMKGVDAAYGAVRIIC